MNYFFLAAAFFAFHLLLAYLVDHLKCTRVRWSPRRSACSWSSATCGSWRAARRPCARPALAQLVFLVLFGYAFFFEGFTGLTVTVGAVLTLFVLMQITARVDWNAVFARPART